MYTCDLVLVRSAIYSGFFQLAILESRNCKIGQYYIRSHKIPIRINTSLKYTNDNLWHGEKYHGNGCGFHFGDGLTQNGRDKTHKRSVYGQRSGDEYGNGFEEDPTRNRFGRVNMGNLRGSGYSYKNGDGNGDGDGWFW